MRPTNLLALITALFFIGGCDPTPSENPPSSTATTPPHEDASRSDRLTIVGYQLMPGVNEDEVDKLLLEGRSEQDLAALGLVTDVRKIIPERQWSKDPQGAWAIDDESIGDGQTLSLVLLQSERVNVYHSPSSNTCRAIQVHAGVWWLPANVLPQVRSEWYWRVGSNPWNQWGTFDLFQLPVAVPVWAGSDGPTFRYAFINHAFAFSVPGVSEPGLREVTIRAISEAPSFCGHHYGGSW